MNNEFIWETAVGVVLALLAWLIGIIKSMTEKKIDSLELKHQQNSDDIAKIKDRVITLEHTTVKRDDLDYILGTWQEELKGDIDKSFVRVHGRIDELYNDRPEKDANTYK